jgi:hypothetical protein
LLAIAAEFGLGTLQRTVQPPTGKT